jgi:methylglutaconyl-CoA hydratase
MAYRYLSTRRDDAVEYVTLNRPEVRNALNGDVIAELDDWAAGIRDDPHVRVAVLAGAGKSFSAGADVVWMAKTITFTNEENLRDAKAAARMFEALDNLPIPLVGRVQGAALGGGAGLVAVCDVVVAEETALFGFTEVKLGLAPAIISPYVLAKVGRSAARELFLTGALFPASRAQAIGLVHTVVPTDTLDSAMDRRVHELLTSEPLACKAAKSLIAQVWAREPREVADVTTATIAGLRVSARGQEGLQAFLQKRKPSWVA